MQIYFIALLYLPPSHFTHQFPYCASPDNCGECREVKGGECARSAGYESAWAAEIRPGQIHLLGRSTARPARILFPHRGPCRGVGRGGAGRTRHVAEPIDSAGHYSKGRGANGSPGKPDWGAGRGEGGAGEARARAAGSRGARAREPAVSRAWNRRRVSAPQLSRSCSCSCRSPEQVSARTPTPLPAAQFPRGRGEARGAGAAGGPGSLGAGPGAAASPSPPPSRSGPLLARLKVRPARPAAEMELRF